ncbi:hypothetical protein Hanom_Chr03g00221451 [Helianthus anomalus]
MMVHDPDPEVLLRITICQRNKDHWLGSCVRIMYDKNPALTGLLLLISTPSNNCKYKSIK